MKIRKVVHLGSALLLSIASALSINLGSALAVVQNCAWTGATNNNFNNSGNWSSCGGSVPAAGDNLVFNNSSLVSDTSLNNDIAGMSVHNMTFQGSGSSIYDISGNSLTLTGVLLNNTTAGRIVSLSNPIVLSGAPSLNTTAGSIALSGSLSGSGDLAISGGNIVFLDSNNSSYSGNITVSAGQIWISNANALGNTTGVTVISNGASILFDESSLGNNATIAEPMTVAGSGDGTAFSNYAIGAAQCFSNGCTPSYTITLSGNITFVGDTTINPNHIMNLTGNLSGAYNISVAQGWPGSLVIQSPSNNSSTANGTYQAPKVTITLSDSQPSTPVSIGFNETYVIDGQRQDIFVDTGGTLKGTGTVGTLTLLSGATLAPGHSPGCINTGDLTLSGNYDVEIGGTAACTGYDQTNVTGTVDVTGATLNTTLYNNYKPKAGEVYTIIKNDGADAVTGTFTGLAEGATFNLSGNVFKISYVGGDGNDVVLSVVSVPATPDTGFAMISSNPGMTAAAAALAAGAILLIARRTKKFAVVIRK